MSFASKMTGIYHFMSDRVPGNVPLVEPKPRAVNPWCSDGEVLVARVAADGDIRSCIDKAVSLLGGLEKAINRGDRVLVKPNLNSADPYPGSTDLEFLCSTVELLLETGAKVTIGESAGGIWRPTRNVFRELGMFEIAQRLGAELIAFDDRADNWVKVKIDGDYLDSVIMPRSAYEADKIVYIPCMKTHYLARYTGALKLAVGFMHPGERRSLHTGHLEQKIAEISLCWQPDLVVMDGRKTFISGGPDKGQLAEPGLLLASGDAVAVDIEAMKVILSYKAKNRLAQDPWQSLQVSTAIKHGLGPQNGDYKIVQ